MIMSDDVKHLVMQCSSNGLDVSSRFNPEFWCLLLGKNGCFAPSCSGGGWVSVCAIGLQYAAFPGHVYASPSAREGTNTLSRSLQLGQQYYFLKRRVDEQCALHCRTCLSCTRMGIMRLGDRGGHVISPFLSPSMRSHQRGTAVNTRHEKILLVQTLRQRPSLRPCCAAS